MPSYKLFQILFGMLPYQPHSILRSWSVTCVTNPQRCLPISSRCTPFEEERYTFWTLYIQVLLILIDVMQEIDYQHSDAIRCVYQSIPDSQNSPSVSIGLDSSSRASSSVAVTSVSVIVFSVRSIPSSLIFCIYFFLDVSRPWKTLEKINCVINHNMLP